MINKQKIFLGRKVEQLSAAFFGLVFIVSACKKDETNIGSGLQDANLNVVTVDTFSIITYSEEIDSMESDESGISLLGAYNDPVFGGVNCGIVTQIVPEAFTQDFPDLADITMDSVVLSLRYSSINYYANLDEISVEVYEIDDVLQRDDQVYYTSDEPTITGSNLAVSDPLILDPDVVKEAIVGEDTLPAQLRIHLNTDVGLDLVADSKAGLMGENFASSTFKGLYIRVAVDEEAAGFGLPSGHGTVLYFALEDVLSKMTIYYRDLAGEADAFDFDINSTCARYNKIQYKREGTIVDQTLEDASLGEEAFYYQGGAIQGVIELPYISNLSIGPDGEVAPKIINNAVLILPIQDFQTDPFDPTTSLNILRIIDEKRSTYPADYGFGGIYLSQNAVSYDEDNKEFRFVMTREIQDILNGDLENIGYRIYSPAFFASTVERIIFNGSNTTLKEKPRLEITYTEY